MNADLFPLPLSPFEYYYLCDDRPEYPTTFPVELVFSPPLSSAQFQRALEVVILRHPLLGSLVAEDGRLGPCWIGGAQLTRVDWAGQEIPISHADGERIDLRRAPAALLHEREVVAQVVGVVAQRVRREVALGHEEALVGLQQFVDGGDVHGGLRYLCHVGTTLQRRAGFMGRMATTTVE